MPIKFEDYGNLIVESCKLIIDGIKSVEPILNRTSSLPEKDVAKIDRMFVRLTLLTRGLRELVYPTPSSGEIHGLPREATDGASKPEPIATHTERPDWDFQPWLTEKVLAMSKAMDLLIREAEKKFHSHKPLPGKIAGSPDLVFHAGCVCNLAKVMIEMFESDQLKYSDVEIEEE